MDRIRKAYEVRFRTLLQRVRARQLDRGIQWLFGKARRLEEREGVPQTEALTRVHDALARRSSFRTGNVAPAPIRFFCDAGLGGLARWLRGAGCEALWKAGIDDDELLREAKNISATVLTTDSLLMERRVLRDGSIPSLWLPPTLSIAEQLAAVFREFGLATRGPRCMSCGGELKPGDKEALRERIPPRTYRWLDEYFVCSRCDKLFWHGTHWLKITKALRDLPD